MPSFFHARHLTVPVLALHQRLRRWPPGIWLFSQPAASLQGRSRAVGNRLLMLPFGFRSFGFSRFHFAFGRLCAWPRSHAGTTIESRAVIRIRNAQLVFVFHAVAAACLAFSESLAGAPLRRALLAATSLFRILG